MAYVAPQSEKHAREAADVTYKIEKTINSARLQIGVRIESKNILADYFLSLDLNLC
jgi:hypothetical protein